MTFLAMLIAGLTSVSIIVQYSMVIVCATMAIVAIYYSFIKRMKRVRALSKTFKKRKKHAMQQVNHHEREIKEQSFAWDMGVHPSSFKESLVLSKKDYKRIFIFSLIVFLVIFVPFFLSFCIEGEKLIKNGMDIQQMIASGPVLFTVYVITTAFVIFVMACVAFSLPVILILSCILNQRVKKMIKRLEKFA